MGKKDSSEQRHTEYKKISIPMVPNRFENGLRSCVTRLTGNCCDGFSYHSSSHVDVLRHNGYVSKSS
jgi:hypothetical protein